MKIGKILINLALVILAAILSYLLYQSIRRPIVFKETREARELVIQEKLKEIAELQKMYKVINNHYANSFDSLEHSLVNDTFFIEKVIGDIYDTTQVVVRKIVAIPAKDSLTSFIKEQGYTQTIAIPAYFDSLSLVPFAKEPTVFFVRARDSVSVENMDDVKQPAFEVGTTIGKYMPEFDSIGYVIYDPGYKPATGVRKIGDISKPNKTSGNW